MKAPCRCPLGGAAALPRPPEPVGVVFRFRRRAPRVSPATAAVLLWCILWCCCCAAATAAAVPDSCPVRSDALDVASRAYVAPQIVEAVVRDANQPTTPGQPYTVSVAVSRVLRRYRGPARVKKHATLSLTFRYPYDASDVTDSDGGDSDSAASNNNHGTNSARGEQCLVSAALVPDKKYLFFLSGGDGNERGAPPLPIASPESASKRLRRVVRKMVCNKCGSTPTVNGLRDDSVVRDYNLTLECTVKGTPLPQVTWYKDDLLLEPATNLKIRNRIPRRQRVTRGSRTQRDRRHSLRPPAGTSTSGRRPRGYTGPRRDTERRPLAVRRRRVRQRRRGPLGEENTPGRPRIRERPRSRSNTRIRSSSSSSSNISQSNSDSSSNSRSSSSSSSSSSSIRSTSTRRSRGSRRRKAGDGKPGDGKLKADRTRPQQVLVSHLEVRDAQEKDAGVYKCVAKSVAGEASAEARIRVIPPIDPHPFVDKCPYSGYCLNGGTCMMFTIVGELVCQCAEGFKGQRCQEKEVYPSFSQNCHGPLRHIRHSHGLRCPRNQPHALWELLQQHLARSQKVSPWTKPHLLSWSPTHHGHLQWSRYMRPGPHSSLVPRPGINLDMTPTHSGPTPTSVLPQTPSFSLHTTQNPMILASDLPNFDLSQVSRRRGHLGHNFLPSSSPALLPQQQMRPHIDHPAATPSSSLQQRVRPDIGDNVQLDLVVGSPPPVQNVNRENGRLKAVQHHSQTHHHHRHQHLKNQKALRSQNSPKEGQLVESGGSVNERQSSDAGLTQSPIISNTSAPPLSSTTPDQQQ